MQTKSGYHLGLEERADLGDSGARYRALLEAAPIAMFIVNHKGNIVLVNLEAEKEFGYRQNELVGRRIKHIIPEGLAERLVAADASAQQNGSPMELRGRRKGGTEFPIEVLLSRLESADGPLLTAVVRDISARKNAETHLAHLEDRCRGLLEAAPDAMVVVNQREEIVLLNAQAEKRFGYPRDELVGLSVEKIIPQGFTERVSADSAGSSAGTQYVGQWAARAPSAQLRVELFGRRKDGGAFPIEIVLSRPQQSAEDTLVTAAIRDISVRKAAEQRLAQLENRYRGLLEAAPDAMVVVKQCGEIVLLNAQAEKRFGYRREELVGGQVRQIIPRGFLERLMANDDETPALESASQLGAEDRSPPSSSLRAELSGRRKDGSEFPIEIVQSRPLESEDGILVTAAIRDISVRRAAERQLAQAESRYRGLLEGAPDAMVVVNQAGDIVLVNTQAENGFGYRRVELIGQQVTKIIPLGFTERWLADGLRMTEDPLARRLGTGIELVGRRKDGSEFPIEIMLSPRESREGTSVTATIRDITLRKNAEAELLEKVAELNRSNEELEQFAYVASHDLQEPLRMVASYTQLLSKRYKGKLDPDADEFIAFAVNGASRMQRLIHDLLMYSRVGRRGKDLRESSSKEALEHALRNLRGSIEESGAKVTYDALPTVLADELQLIQLFQNLVGNAIKYQRSGAPSVHVSAVKQGEKQWIFSVRDNGLGIDAQYFDKIFGMFQRLHKREEFAGTGIGLAICKKIVERHGGSITVESQPGHGSTFSFSLLAEA